MRIVGNRVKRVKESESKLVREKVCEMAKPSCSFLWSLVTVQYNNTFTCHLLPFPLLCTLHGSEKLLVRIIIIIV